MNTLLIILITLLLLYLVVVWLGKSLRKKWTLADQKLFDEHWQNILKMEDGKHAILEADKLLDQMLKKRGYQGSLGDKLKKAKGIFSDNNAVWEAHKLRNKIAHELNFNLRVADRQRALTGFRKAFKDLGLLR